MQFYATVDANGLPTAFYNDDIYPPNADGSENAAIPSDVLALTSAQWQECIDNSGMRMLVVNPDNTVSVVAYAPPAQPEVAPSTISDRQFFQQLAVTPDPSKSDGSCIITQDEALAAVCTGTVPASMEPLITSLPQDEQFAARMKIAGATQFDIADPVTQAFAGAYGWSEAQLNAFWLAASQL